MRHTLIDNLLKLALCLTFMVILLGAYTRLTQAGLGCPDWPLCYGKWLPKIANISVENLPKAWTEMIHRYLAGSLIVLMTLLIGCLFLQHHTRRTTSLEKGVGVLLFIVLIAQPLLGMWTVTLKLHPWIVATHLLGGFALVSLLWWLRLLLMQPPPSLMAPHDPPMLAYFASFSLGIVVIQIFLGALVSSHYASLACLGFPTCNGHYWPPIDWSSWLSIPPLGPDYEYGVLHHPARVTIHFLHRLGALITTVLLLVLSYCVWTRYYLPCIRRSVLLVCLFLSLQLLLGMINVIYLLPLFSAVAHNGIAACLLLALITVVHYLFNCTQKID